MCYAIECYVLCQMVWITLNVFIQIKNQIKFRNNMKEVINISLSFESYTIVLKMSFWYYIKKKVTAFSGLSNTSYFFHIHWEKVQAAWHYSNSKKISAKIWSSMSEIELISFSLGNWRYSVFINITDNSMVEIFMYAILYFTY